MKKLSFLIPLFLGFFLFAGLFLSVNQSYACSTGNDCNYWQYCDGGVWPFNNGTCRNFNIRGTCGQNGTCDCTAGNNSGNYGDFGAPALGGWNGYNGSNDWPWMIGAGGASGVQGMACPMGIIFGQHTRGINYCQYTFACTASEYGPNNSNYAGTYMCEMPETGSYCGYDAYAQTNVGCFQGAQYCTNYQGCVGGGYDGPCPGNLPFCECICPVHTQCVDAARTSSGFWTYSGYNTPCTSMWCDPYCTTGGPVNCGSYTVSQPTNTCGTSTATRTCQHNTNPNGTCSITSASNYTDYGTQQYNYCNTGYTCPNINGAAPVNCVTNITVHVYTDYNHDGVKNGNDAAKQGVSISDGGGNTFQTDGTGAVTFTGKDSGTYTITMTTPTNFQVTNSVAQTSSGANNNTAGSPKTYVTFNLGAGGNEQVYFYVTPLYAISGNVFSDANKNQKFDVPPDTAYGSGTISVSGGPTTVANITVAGNGTWTTPTTLESGTYTVSDTAALSTGYSFTTPSSFAVTVGDPAGSPVCNVGTATLDAVCGGTNNGSISKLDFGLTNENQWGQSVCFDVRDDSGTYTDQIPAAPSCGGVSGAYDSVINGDCSTGAGIIFTCDATPNFGLGSANANGWQAGGTTPNNECFTGAGLDVIRTSYDYLLTTARQSNITPIDMTTVCGAGGLANCTLPSNLAKGVYIAQGDVNLNAYTFPVDPTAPQGFIFLINGNLHLQGNIIVPAGSAAAFSTSSNIYVDPSVGNTITNASDPAVNNPNLEGLYSADANFIIQSNTTASNICNADGTPLDKKLNIVGSVITNAAQRGGSFQDNRDLCIYDTSCPAASVGDSNGLALSYILTLFADGGFLNHKTFNWQELRP